MDVEQLLFEGNYSSARSLIEAFDPEEDNLCEATFLELYSIYANYLESVDEAEPMSESDSMTLHALASLCPGTYGPAIYQARALYRYIYPYVNEFDSCDDGEGSRIASKQLNRRDISDDSKWNVDIFPNPANDHFTLKSNYQIDMLSVVISDISGRNISELKIETVDRLASIGVELGEGLYFVSVTSTSNETIVRKLVISR